MSRRGEAQRKTKETEVHISLNLDGQGQATVDTGIGFLDHMLDQVARHGLMDLTVTARGDRQVDDHHTVEDVGIVFGQALHRALGDRAGIVRYAAVYTPMDEALSRIVLDFSGRPYLHFDVRFLADRVGLFEVQLVEEFFRAVSVHGGLTLHMTTLSGTNDHHIIETLFKGFGRSVDQAAREDSRIQGTMSTKGNL